jgi:hypothetical protein
MLIQSLLQSSRNVSRRIRVNRANVGPVILLSIQPLCQEPHSLSSNGPLIRGVDHRHVLDIGYQPLELVGGFPERVLGVADAELNCDRLGVLVGHPKVTVAAPCFSLIEALVG